MVSSSSPISLGVSFTLVYFSISEIICLFLISVNHEPTLAGIRCRSDRYTAAAPLVT